MMLLVFKKETSMAQTAEYIPGVCNIGKAEINQRLRFGWIGVGFTLVLAAVFFASGIAPAWRLLLFFPAAGAATGLLQGYLHFCSGFGFKGVLNFGSEVGKTDTVMQAEFRKKDRQKALNIILWSGLIGAAVAVATFLIV